MLVSRSYCRNFCFSLVNPAFSELGQVKRLQFWLPSSGLSWVPANCCLSWLRSWVTALYPLLQYSGFPCCFARHHWQSYFSLKSSPHLVVGLTHNSLHHLRLAKQLAPRSVFPVILRLLLCLWQSRRTGALGKSSFASVSGASMFSTLSVLSLLLPAFLT